MGLAKACFSLFRVGIGWSFCGAGEERNCRRPFRQRARRRAEERNALSSEKHSCFRLHPAHKKRDPKRSLSFVELEKKGTAGGRSASERGDEPRSGTLPTSPLSHASDSRQFHKKRPLPGGHVELEGVEPHSQMTLITILFEIILTYLVSDFDIRLFCSYTKLLFQAFHRTLRDVGQFSDLSVRITLSQKFQGFPILSLFLVFRFPITLTTQSGFPSQGDVLLHVSPPTRLQSEHDVLSFELGGGSEDCYHYCQIRVFPSLSVVDGETFLLEIDVQMVLFAPPYARQYLIDITTQSG